HVDRLEAGLLGEPRHDRVERNRRDDQLVAIDELTQSLQDQLPSDLMPACTGDDNRDHYARITLEPEGEGGMIPLHSRRRLGPGMVLPAAWMLVVAVSPAAAETYPARTVTIVTPFAAGSQTDTAARIVGQYLQDALGQPFVVGNKAGAGGLVTPSTVGRARPDGHQLLVTTKSTQSAVALFKNVPYDPINDFTPIARLGNFPSFVAVNVGVPVTSMAELVARAKASPGKMTYGTGNSTGQIV